MSVVRSVKRHFLTEAENWYGGGGDAGRCSVYVYVGWDNKEMEKKREGEKQEWKRCCGKLMYSQ